METSLKGTSPQLVPSLACLKESTMEDQMIPSPSECYFATRDSLVKELQEQLKARCIDIRLIEERYYTMVPMGNEMVIVHGSGRDLPETSLRYCLQKWRFKEKLGIEFIHGEWDGHIDWVKLFPENYCDECQYHIPYHSTSCSHWVPTCENCGRPVSPHQRLCLECNQGSGDGLPY
jgi:hypothetical protein